MRCAPRDLGAATTASAARLYKIRHSLSFQNNQEHSKSRNSCSSPSHSRQAGFISLIQLGAPTSTIVTTRTRPAATSFPRHSASEIQQPPRALSPRYPAGHQARAPIARLPIFTQTSVTTDRKRANRRPARPAQSAAGAVPQPRRYPSASQTYSYTQRWEYLGTKHN